MSLHAPAAGSGRAPPPATAAEEVRGARAAQRFSSTLAALLLGTAQGEAAPEDVETARQLARELRAAAQALEQRAAGGDPEAVATVQARQRKISPTYSSSLTAGTGGMGVNSALLGGATALEGARRRAAARAKAYRARQQRKGGGLTAADAMRGY